MRMKLIGNRYRVKGLIGEGGMASVYSAIDEKLDRRVAIKLLHSHLARNDDIRQRFHQEARSISGIDHPNIIKIYDFSGVDSDQLWIVTEILYGVDLAEYVQRFPKNRLHPLVATLIAREICRALSEAHQHGIVHRDIKPENIMVLDSGRIKLMDFGIAKVAQNPSATQTGTFMGSPSYMSPEQIRGTRIDQRTDIYSLCVLFYEIVAGILPFVGNTTPDVINKIIVGKFSPPIAINPLVPQVLNRVIIKGLKAKREERFDDADQLASQLDAFLRQCEMTESHVELERFFRSPMDFEKKLTAFNRNNQVKPQLLKFTDPDNQNKPPQQGYVPPKEKAQQATPRSKTQVKSPQPQSHAGTPIQKARPRQQTQNPHPRPAARNHARRSVSSARHNRAPGSAHQAAMRLTSTRKSSNLFWNILLFFSFGAATFAIGLVIINSTQDLNQALDTKQEATRQSTRQPPPQREASVPQQEPTASTPISTPSPGDSEGQQRRQASQAEPGGSEPRSPRSEQQTTSTGARRPSQSAQATPPASRPNTTVRRSPPEAAEPSEPRQAETPPGRNVPSTPSSAGRNTRQQTPIAMVQQNPSIIHVRSFPSSEIYIDDQLVGATNDRRLYQRGINLSPGRYQLSLRRSGYEPAEELIEVKENEVLRLNYVLSRNQVYIPLTLRSNRIPALVYIDEIKNDGRKRQVTLKTSSHQVQLEPGTYRIEVVYSGQSIERVIEFKEDSDAFTFNANFN